MVTNASSAASGMRLYADTSALASASSRVSMGTPFSRSITCSASMSSKFMMLSFSWTSWRSLPS